MKIELPFSAATIDELSNKTMVLCENNRNESVFHPFLTVNVQGGGELYRGFFEVVNGVLRLIDRQGLFCEFAGLEARNGVVFATGTASQTASRSGFDRITMHERKRLSVQEIGICVSSHLDYAEKTLPLLLGSIRKAKLDMDRVVVYVGGFNGEKEEQIEGSRVVYRNANLMGFGGLSVAGSGFPYWLLIHDTCEMDRTFIETFNDVDVGLSPDVIRLDDKDWMGIYSLGFLNLIRDEIGESSDVVMSAMNRKMSVLMTMPGKVKVEVMGKDVYGTGIPRNVERIGLLGIKKFRTEKSGRVRRL